MGRGTRSSDSVQILSVCLQCVKAFLCFGHSETTSSQDICRPTHHEACAVVLSSAVVPSSAGRGHESRIMGSLSGRGVLFPPGLCWATAVQKGLDGRSRNLHDLQNNEEELRRCPRGLCRRVGSVCGAARNSLAWSPPDDILRSLYLSEQKTPKNIFYIGSVGVNFQQMFGFESFCYACIEMQL